MSEAKESSSAPSLEMAHVLFMDIVSYSTFHMDRQRQLLHELQEAVRSTSAFAHAVAEDQLIRLPTGDGMALVFFHDPEAPVRCALELSKTLRGNPDVKLRMGIHTGPVYRLADINANRNVAGGGINIAQRVMDCGDAGHILVSSSHAEVLCQISSWCAMLHDLGEVEVKHGLRLHVYNLHDDEMGNPGVPQKISIQRAAASLTASASNAASVAASRARSRNRYITTTATAVGVVAVLAASVGAWTVIDRSHAVAERKAAIADIERLVDIGRFVDVWRIAQPALRRWPNDPRLQQLQGATTMTVTIATDPPGADVAFKAVDDIKGEWIPLGMSPLKGVRAPLGILRWRITKSGFEPIEASRSRAAGCRRGPA